MRVGGLRSSTSWTGTVISRRPVNLDGEQSYKVKPSSRNKGIVGYFCQGLLSAVSALESEDDKSDDKDSGAEGDAGGGEHDDNQTPDRNDPTTSDNDDLGGDLFELPDSFDSDFSDTDFLSCLAFEVFLQMLRDSRIQSSVSESAEAMLRSAKSVRADAPPSSPRDASRPEPDPREHNGRSLHHDAPNAGKALHRVSEPQEVNRENKNAPSAVAAPSLREDAGKAVCPVVPDRMAKSQQQQIGKQV